MIELCSGRGRIYLGVSRALLNAFPPSLRHSFLHPQNFRSGFVRVHCACDTVLTLRRGGGQQRVFNSIFEIVFMLTTHSPPGGPSARRPGDPFFRCPFLPLPPSAAAAEVYSERMRSSVRPSVRPSVLGFRAPRTTRTDNGGCLR